MQPLAEQRRTGESGENGLQADDERADTRRHAQMYGVEHAGEVAALHQHPDYRDMPDLGQAARPGRAHHQRKRQHQRHHRDKAQQQKSQRFGIGEAEFGTDKARAPQQHE
jgi:hypothetical protein